MSQHPSIGDQTARLLEADFSGSLGADRVRGLRRDVRRERVRHSTPLMRSSSVLGRLDRSPQDASEATRPQEEYLGFSFVNGREDRDQEERDGQWTQKHVPPSRSGSRAVRRQSSLSARSDSISKNTAHSRRRSSLEAQRMATYDTIPDQDMGSPSARASLLRSVQHTKKSLGLASEITMEDEGMSDIQTGPLDGSLASTRRGSHPSSVDTSASVKIPVLDIPLDETLANFSSVEKIYKLQGIVNDLSAQLNGKDAELQCAYKIVRKERERFFRSLERLRAEYTSSLTNMRSHKQRSQDEIEQALEEKYVAKLKDLQAQVMQERREKEDLVRACDTYFCMQTGEAAH